MKVKKTVTAAKAAANKKNAGNSTGPTSVQGKRNASKNAIRHGILAREVLLPGESATEFEQLLDETIANLSPVGFPEHAHVEMIFGYLWRSRRVYRAEAGEIRKLQSEFNPRAEIATSEHTQPYRQAITDLKQLDLIAEQIGLEGRVDSVHLDWLRGLPYGEPVTMLVDAIELVHQTRDKADGFPDQETPDAAGGKEPNAAKETAISPEENNCLRNLLLNSVEGVKRAIQREMLYHGQYLPLKTEAKRDAMQVPQEAVINRLMRYETHLINQMTNAQHRLERMQRLRRGDEVPLPGARVM
jgi:hypothetical protein